MSNTHLFYYYRLNGSRGNSFNIPFDFGFSESINSSFSFQFFWDIDSFFSLGSFNHLTSQKSHSSISKRCFLWKNKNLVNIHVAFPMCLSYWWFLLCFCKGWQMVGRTNNRTSPWDPVCVHHFSIHCPHYLSRYVESMTMLITAVNSWDTLVQ